MRYFWTLFWTVLLMEMVTYVASSMLGFEFKVETGAILGVVTTILLCIIPSILPDTPSGHDGAH